MKKKIVFLLLVMMIISMFSGCAEKAPEPLRICVDADAFELRVDSCKETLESFLATVAQMGGPSDVILEFLPESGTERDTMITRIRTEMMAGGGPDVFIVDCQYNTDETACR